MHNSHRFASQISAALFGLTCNMASADGGDSLLIHACVDNGNQAVRIVDANTDCSATESSLHWSVQGPPGPTDPVLLGRVSTLESQVATLQAQVASLLGNHLVSAASISDVSLNEGTSSSTTAFSFTVSLDMPSADTVVIDYATAPDTAFDVTDYLERSGQLIFLPGETSKLVTVPVIGDSTPEQDETFVVQLSNPANATLGKASGIGMILNDDTPILSFSGPGSLIEGDTFTYDLVLSGPSPSPVSVNYSLTSGSATLDVDLVDASGTVTFNPGETVAQIFVTTVDDGDPESLEDFSINLDNPINTLLSTSQITSTILDNDLTLAIQPNNVIEGNSGKSPYTNMSMLVTLPSPALGQISVQYGRTAGGTASNVGFFNPNGDVQITNGYSNCQADDPGTYGTCPTLVFNPGESQKSIAILVNGDTAIEGDENFFIKLVNPIGAVISIDVAEGTIIDDDF